MKKASIVLIVLFSCLACNHQNSEKVGHLLGDSPSILGKTEYLNSPMVTAGDRVYSVGHQNGSFPDLGWHVKNEMGGIWNHPIKLMDGYDIRLTYGGDTLVLNQAETFTNYPFANKHTFSWPEKQLDIERWQFVPDGKEGIQIQLVIHNRGGDKKGNIEFIGHSDLLPTWLGERTKMIDGPDHAEYDSTQETWIVKDQNNPWYTVFGSSIELDLEDATTTYEKSGNGVSNGISNNLFLPSQETHLINYTIAGSYHSREAAIQNYQDLKANWPTYLQQKKKRYQHIAQTTKLTIEDKEIQEAFEWIKYNCDWLVRTVPEIGSGIGAGIPDYPWWFGVDSEYALQGYMAIGQHEPVYNTVRLLDSVSNVVNNNSGQIIHEMSTNGAVFNPGNVNETPQFASLIWKIYRWNGDKEFLERYFPTIERGLHWLLEKNDANKNLFPDGYGMMEIHGMDSEMIDVASYTQKAFADAALIANEIGRETLGQDYTYVATQLKNQINAQFWSEESNSYADFIGTDSQALALLDDAILRADTLKKPWAVEELRETKKFILANPSSESRPFVVHHNWVVNTPMEVGIAPIDKAKKALKTAEKFVNPFGVFVTGIDRDTSAGSDDGAFKGSEVFSYTGAVMTLPTGVQIVAENNYGNPDQALNYLKRMTRSFSYALPGSMYEVSPDYGMMTQAWNVYGFAIPIVEQFFGIQPDAANKKVVIQPQMPSSWNEGALENVKVGDNEISVYYHKSGNNTELKVKQSKNWTLEISLPKPQNTAYSVSTNELGMNLLEDTTIVSTQKECKLNVRIDN